MFCIDANIAIALLRGGRPDLEEYLAGLFARDVVIGLATIVLAELQYGVYRARDHMRAQRALDGLLRAPIEIMPFTAADARRAGELRAGLAAKGQTIGPFDSLIAAQALERNMILVTNNIREFSRVPGLKLEDWLTP
jgi:tRNA(fMet)-specific endonuclease VapC